MTQTKLVFSKSLNPIPSIIHRNKLIDNWKMFNKSRRQLQRECLDCDIKELSFRKWLKLSEIDYVKYINKPFDRLEYYKLFSRYLNNFNV